MPAFNVTSHKAPDIATDGRKAILNFVDDQDQSISLKFNVQLLERVAHELGFLLAKARELSELSKQGIAQFLRPARCRAGAVTGQTTVVVTFQLLTGTEMHYGLEPTVAEGLAKQLLESAEEAKKAKPPTRN